MAAKLFQYSMYSSEGTRYLCWSLKGRVVSLQGEYSVPVLYFATNSPFSLEPEPLMESRID